jgi:hypothetical protein
MKTIKIIIPIILLLFITISSCEKKPKAPTTDADGLPFATQTGANTFGCLIDGVPSTVLGAYSDWRYYGGEFTFYGGGVLILHIISQEPRKDFYILSNVGSNTLSTHKANEYFPSGYSNFQNNGGAAPIGGNYYSAIDSLPATITITNYTGNRDSNSKKGDILSGTFDFIMQNSAGKKIHITKGRFDFKTLFD